MASVHDSIPHEIRTASEPRENVLEPVVVTNVREVNESIRLFRLNAADPNHTIKASISSVKIKTPANEERIVVLTGSMARHFYTRPPKGWRLYHYVHTK